VRFRRALVGVVALAAASVALGVVASSAQEQPTSGTFSALTYNVAGLPEGLSGSNPSVNTPLISPLLNDYDLVLVQESWVNPDPPAPGLELFHEVLVSEVTHPYLSTPVPTPPPPDPRRPDALVSDGLNRMSRFPFGDLTRQMWPNCFGGAIGPGAGDCLAQKGFSMARTELAPGVEVDVYNLHAEAGSTELDVVYSAEDFETLAAFIVTHSSGRAVIVGGDYNLHTDEEPDATVFAEFLATTGLTDVCSVVDCGTDADQIDKFSFRSGHDVVIEPLSHAFEREKFQRDDGVPLSDHPALAVDFAWRSETEAFATVTGQVLGPAAEALPGASVWAYAGHDAWFPTAATTADASGTYVLGGLPPGEYRVMFRGPPGTSHVMEWWDDETQRAVATPIAVGAGDVVTAVDAELVVGGRVEGTVTTSGGPAGGVQVWAYADTDRWVGTEATTTAADGTYTIEGIPEGNYRILFRVVDASGLATEWWDDSPTRSGGTLLAVDGDHTPNVNAELAPASP